MPADREAADGEAERDGAPHRFGEAVAGLADPAVLLRVRDRDFDGPSAGIPLPACRCHGGPDDRPGPYIVWTRKVAGRTVARVLTDAEFAACGAYLDGDRQLRQLVDELPQLTLRVVEAGQPTTRKPRAGPPVKRS